MASMTPQKCGKFRVTWYDGSGVRHRKLLPKQKAQELYNQVCAQKLFESSGISQALGGKAASYRKLRFCDLSQRYIDEHLALSRARSNVYYIKILNDKWGDYRLSLISLNEFREWIRLALRSPIRTPNHEGWKLTQLAARSIEKLERYMRRVFTWGIEREIISQTPFIGRVKDQSLKKDFRRLKKFKPVVLTVEEFWNLMESFPTYVKRPAIACYFAGLRRSEVIAARWSRLDRKRHSFSFDADETKESDEKTVFYDPELEPIIEEMEIERITNGYPDDFMFRNSIGTPLTDILFTHSVRHYSDLHALTTNDDKFRKVTPHTFRRSYRTRKDLEGSDRRAIAANMGHHSLATSEIYNIVDEGRQMSIAGYLDSFSENVKAALRLLIEEAKKDGAELSDVQSQLRQLWKSISKEMPID